MKFLNLTLLNIFLSLTAAQARGPLPESLQALEQVLGNIYHVSTQEIVELIKQDISSLKHITAEELHQKIQAQPDLLVINVLTQNWYQDCHITGSQNAPLKELVYLADQWDRNQEIVVYCALDECDASEKACVLLTCMGFANVYEYSGGIKEWFNLGLPTEGPCAASYLQESTRKGPGLMRALGCGKRS
jgi:rhodanese-related sulfurtransferase